MFLKGVHQVGVKDKAVLDGFSPTLGQLPLAQGGQGLHISQHRFGLVKSADEVFALGQVDGYFAANRGVDHRRHTGRHLDEGDAAQEGGGHIASQIADYAAADGDDGMAALGAQADQPFVDGLGQGVGFAGFAGRDDEAVGGDAALLQGALGAAAVAVHQVFVGDDVGGAGEAEVKELVAQLVEDAPTGDDGIGAAGVVDGGGEVWGGHKKYTSL